MTHHVDSSFLAVYIHIPYCAKLCHYCDFAKTSAFDSTQTDRYFQALKTHLQILKSQMVSQQLASVYIGGGTPSLFYEEYEPLFKILMEMAAPDCEVTLEANPCDVTESKLLYYRQLGVSRLSLGVQSLNDQHLSTLTRIHRSRQAIESMELVGSVFENWNVDLIYGIPHQSVDEFVLDLCAVVDFGCPQLSLYHLTFEPQTVMGRRFFRNMIPNCHFKSIKEFYDRLCQVMAQLGYLHEEVSHFVKATCDDPHPMGSCHNWIYWKMGSYFGIGAGASGFVRRCQPWGRRYYFGKNPHHFKVLSDQDISINSDFDEYLARCGAHIDSRDKESYVLEIILSSLRTCAGVPLGMLEALQKTFHPHELIQHQMDCGLIQRTQEHLIFDPRLWLNEQSYIMAMLDSVSDS